MRVVPYDGKCKVTALGNQVIAVAVGVYQLRQDWATRPGPQWDYCGIGHIEVVQEFAMLLSRRAKTEFASWKPSSRALTYPAAKTIRLVELTERYQIGSPTVGGRVDAIRSAKGGTSHWLDRKPNCPVN